MKYKLQKICFTLLLSMAMLSSIAQTKAPAATIFTADSLVSGNTKDVLTSFFQLAFDNLIGQKKELNFNSNPFAVMLKSNPNLNLDKYYTKYRPWRKLNFGFGLKLDTSYRFNGFSSSIKYSIIDERDPTTSNLLFTRLQIAGFADEREILNKALMDSAQKIFKASAQTDADFDQLSNFRDTVSIFFNQKIAFKDLGKNFQQMVLSLAAKNKLVQIQKLLTENPATSLKSNDLKIYDSLKNAIKKCLLWTVSINDTTYQKQFFFSNVVINSELSKGIFEPRPGANNVELNLKAACNFLTDTLRSAKNLKRVLFSFEPGVNWVIRDKNSDRSYFELKLSGSYYHNFSSLYAKERRDSLTLNTVMRIRVINDIWIPLEVKYDPKTGNVFGFLNIKANFTALGNLFKKDS
ncbi:hypothetical protein [Ferruginibacter sp.]